MKDKMEPEKAPGDFTEKLMARIEKKEDVMEQAMFAVMRNHLIERPSASFTQRIMSALPAGVVTQKPLALRWLAYISLGIIGVIIGVVQLLNGDSAGSNGLSDATSGMMNGFQQMLEQYPMVWTMVLGLAAIIVLDGSLRLRNASKA